MEVKSYRLNWVNPSSLIWLHFLSPFSLFTREQRSCLPVCSSGSEAKSKWPNGGQQERHHNHTKASRTERRGGSDESISMLWEREGTNCAFARSRWHQFAWGSHQKSTPFLPLLYSLPFSKTAQVFQIKSMPLIQSCSQQETDGTLKTV